MQQTGHEGSSSPPTRPLAVIKTSGDTRFEDDCEELHAARAAERAARLTTAAAAAAPGTPAADGAAAAAASAATAAAAPTAGAAPVQELDGSIAVVLGGDWEVCEDAAEVAAMWNDTVARCDQDLVDVCAVGMSRWEDDVNFGSDSDSEGDAAPHTPRNQAVRGMLREDVEEEEQDVAYGMPSVQHPGQISSAVDNTTTSKQSQQDKKEALGVNDVGWDNAANRECGFQGFVPRNPCISAGPVATGDATGAQKGATGASGAQEGQGVLLEPFPTV